MKNDVRLKRQYDFLFAKMLLGFAGDVLCELFYDNVFVLWLIALANTYEQDETSASETYARHGGRQSTADCRKAVEDDERERTRSGGLASAVPSIYDENFAHRLKRAGNEQNGYRHFSYDANGNVIEEKDTISANPNEETAGLLPATMSVTSNANGETVYQSDYAWGYFKDAPTGSSYGGSYKRSYSWDSRNLLIASSDNTNQVYYIYDANGERTNKYTHRSETLYFNTFWNWHKDSAIPLGQYSKNIYLGTTRLVTKLHKSVDELPASQVSTKNYYYYHSDHLGSAQLITDSKGEEYQRLEYTPYGELWIEKTSSEASAKYLPYKFTGKERDEETGLYYYGARYMDPKYSRWLSTDPALNDYVGGTSSGEGGIYNHVNLSLYHYAGNNPLKYIDPDGKKQNFAQKAFTKALSFGVSHSDKFANFVKQNTSIVIYRSSNDNGENGQYFQSKERVELCGIQLNEIDVQSTADYTSEVEAGREQTISDGEYTGTLLNKSGSYNNAISITGNGVSESDAVLCHPNAKTAKGATEEYANGERPYGAGCQISHLKDFNEVTGILEDVGFEYGKGDETWSKGDNIKIIIKPPVIEQ